MIVFDFETQNLVAEVEVRIAGQPQRLPLQE